MRYSRNIHIGIIVIGCLIIGVIFLQGDGVTIGSLENQDDIRLELGIWTSDTKIEQTFIASQNDLCRIDFFVDSYHPWDNPYLDCRLFEIDALDNPHEMTYEFIHNHIKDVRYKRMNGWLISGHMFNSFSFTPISDSQNKHYLLSIQSPGLKKGGTSILLSSPRERYEQGDLFVNGKKKTGDLAFRVLYLHPRLELIRKSVARLALQKPYPFSKPATYYVLFMVYITLLIILLGWLSQREYPKQGERDLQ